MSRQVLASNMAAVDKVLEEKGEARIAQAPEVIYLDHGAIVLRNFLSVEEQLHVLETSKKPPCFTPVVVHVVL